MRSSPSRPLALLSSALASVLALGCAESGPGGADFPPLAKKWFERGEQSFRQGDVEDAELAVENALRADAQRAEIRILGARIALARLEYARALQLLSGVPGTEAASIRGRALWYAGDIEKAADELERLVADPEVRDPWASDIAKLSRRGIGRKPFDMIGGLVSVTDMPRVGAALIVPLEVSGEPALGMIATGTPEVVVDSSRGGEPSWVSLRFGDRIEVRDVPALSKDLSGISRQVNAPIRVLLGVNLLRHLHPTFDLMGGQFVVRNFDAPAPPAATAVKVSYVRGGGMLLRGALGGSPTATSPASLLIDTGIPFPVALDDAGWKKAGVPLSSLRAVPNQGALRQGVIPLLRMGAFDVPSVPGLSSNEPVKEREDGLGIDLDGLVGSAMFASFRVTLVDRGRTMWLEDLPHEALEPQAPLDFSVPEADDSQFEGLDDAPDDSAPAKDAPKAGGLNPSSSKAGAPPKAPGAKAGAKP